MQMQRRCLRLGVGDSSRPLARLTSERDNVVVPAVPESDTGESGQGVALASYVVRLARDPKRLSFRVRERA
jgi:hypothetical protein